MPEPIVRMTDGSLLSVGEISHVKKHHDSMMPHVFHVELYMRMASHIVSEVTYLAGTLEQEKIVFAFLELPLYTQGVEATTKLLAEFDWQKLVGRKVWIEFTENGPKGRRASYVGFAG